jgi:hypothetical protein
VTGREHSIWETSSRTALALLAWLGVFLQLWLSLERGNGESIAAALGYAVRGLSEFRRTRA